ncbi:hypothetical protein ACQP2F_32345 [Actinoplanes sp. CA-030573]|uniref:hypothetical protein n=1 Tax=Actinoplanes sp. CA-030573 TaxID=3239898 RepID=UPI003D8D0E28
MVELARSHVSGPFYDRRVDRLMRAASRVHELGNAIMINRHAGDVVNDTVSDKDGSVAVPAMPVSSCLAGPLPDVAAG